MARIRSSRYRLKQLILYIASKMGEAEFFGVTKLNKVLYRTEHASYRELGHKLTSFQYQKNDHGPTLRAFVPVTAEMKDEGLIDWEIRSDEKRLRPLAAPDMSVFSPRETALIDREIDRAWSLTATQISEEEHATAAWFATKMGESIRPELCFVEDPGNIIPLTDDEEEWAKAAIERYRARPQAAAGDRARA